MVNVPHTRASRGDNASRPLRLQRIRRPGGAGADGGPNGKNKSGRGMGGNVSTRSQLFHQQGSVGDMSDYNYSVRACVNNHGEGEDESSAYYSTEFNNYNDNDTVGDESLYTTAQTVKTQSVKWEDAQLAEMDERERKMTRAGIDNSIPTSLYIGRGMPQVSQLNVQVSKLNMNSFRSIQSLDPTEEESQEGNQSSQEQQLQQHTSNMQVRTIPEEEPSVEVKRKKSFLKRLFKAIFGSKNKGMNSSSKRGNHCRGSLTKTPTELWNSTPVKKHNKPKRTTTPQTAYTSATTGTGSNYDNNYAAPRHASAPPKMAPRDLWAPEQAAERGIPAAKLRVSNGVKVWENQSGRIIPFNAAEC